MLCGPSLGAAVAAQPAEAEPEVRQPLGTTQLSRTYRHPSQEGVTRLRRFLIVPDGVLTG